MRPFLTNSERETYEAGRALAAGLARGDVLLIEGPLGAGKTAFVRGVTAGLGGAPDDVTSPTFTLIQEYRAPATRVYHVDLYRLTAHEAADLGLEELAEEGVVAVEWPDRWTSPPRGARRIVIDDLGGTSRRIVIDPA